jgi:hypothetical protein
LILILQLSEGRKQVGGKLEVKIRIRDPFKGKQVEETKEKWLVIDQFIRALGPKVKHVCTKVESQHFSLRTVFSDE